MNAFGNEHGKVVGGESLYTADQLFALRDVMDSDVCLTSLTAVDINDHSDIAVSAWHCDGHRVGLVLTMRPEAFR